MFKTDLREHFAWGVLLAPFYCLYFFKDRIALLTEPEQFLWLIIDPQFVCVFTHFIVGAIFCDLDLCLSPNMYPRVKVWSITAQLLCSLLIMISSGNITPVAILACIVWSQFYLITHMLQLSGLLFILVGVSTTGHHRASAFHSLFYWFLLSFVADNAASMVIELLPLTEGIFLKNCLLCSIQSLATGATAHIFLDHLGSMFQYNFNPFVTLQFLKTFVYILSFESLHKGGLLCNIKEVNIVRENLISCQSNIQSSLVQIWQGEIAEGLEELGGEIAEGLEEAIKD